MVFVLGPLSLSGCESFEPQACGDLYVHTYYGGGLSGYRYVLVNDAPSLRFLTVDAVERYMDSDGPKVTFENENPLVVSCGSRVFIRSDSRPATNTLGDRVVVEVVEPHELIEDETSSNSFVIR